MSEEQSTQCEREIQTRKSDEAWMKHRKSKRAKVKKSHSKENDESFIERQAENELEDLLVKTAFSTLF